MKPNHFIFLFLLAILFFSCEEKGDGNNILGPGGGNVSFQVAVIQDQQGTNFFGANPSVSVKVTTITITQADIQFNDTFTNPDPNEAVEPLQNGQYYGFYEIPQQAQTGQEWLFRFKGTLTQGGQSFDVTSKLTIQ
jgi:hypothetical protein